MLLKQVLEIHDLLDRCDASGKLVEDFLKDRGGDDITVTTVHGDEGSTDFIKIVVKGKDGRSSGGNAPTLGIIGRLGGIGARPEVTGFVSDGDGALAALSAALKLIDMKNHGDQLEGDVIITTHICPDAPTQEHFPVPFMGSPVDIDQMNNVEVIDEMDAIISIDTTKGNEVINCNGIALSPTVKEGYILPVSYDLLQVAKRVTGKHPNVFALSTQDITPYANGLPHLNSILQPAIATDSPVVGVAVATEVAVAGCATGATHALDVETAARFAIEVAKDYTTDKCTFYCKDNFKSLIDMYGDCKKYQSTGK